MELHAFDQAVALTAQEPDSFLGDASRAYWNMVGPFGGISAAVVLNAVMQHPALLGEPVSLTVNYAAGLVQGPFAVTARAVRTNRSTQHWLIEVLQPDAFGQQQAMLTASAITALRRDTWSGSDMPLPPVPPPCDVARQFPHAPLEWLKRYEFRFIAGEMPRQFDGAVREGDPKTDSLSQLWMRDDPPRPLDFCSMAAFADIFYPRVYLRRASRVAVGTVSMTVYFHAGGDELRTLGDCYVLGQARGQVFRAGFFDQSAQLWSESGTLLATSLQLVYYKE